MKQEGVVIPVPSRRACSAIPEGFGNEHAVCSGILWL
jgi:hypothetical protein